MRVSNFSCLLVVCIINCCLLLLLFLHCNFWGRHAKCIHGPLRLWPLCTKSNRRLKTRHRSSLCSSDSTHLHHLIFFFIIIFIMASISGNKFACCFFFFFALPCIL